MSRLELVMAVALFIFLIESGLLEEKNQYCLVT